MNSSRNSSYKVSSASLKHVIYRLVLQQVDFEWAVKLNQCSLTLIGLWRKPGQTRRQKLFCDLRVIFVFSTILGIIGIPAIHSLKRIYNDILLAIDNLQFTLPVITVVLRIVIFRWKIKDIESLIDVVHDDWLKAMNSREKMTMITKAQTARTIITLGFIIMWLSTSICVGLPACGLSLRYMTNVTDPGRPLPLQTYYIYDITKSPQYEITFTGQTFTMFLCTLSYTGIDNFLSLLVFHICGQLSILKERIMKLDLHENFEEVLKSCAMDHARLLSAIGILDDVFNIMLLLLFIYFGTLFAFYGFLLISLFEDGYRISPFRVVYLVITFINLFGHMCLYCTVGDILTMHCDQIHYAAYSHKWYTLTPRKAKNVILLMVRTHEPMNLTVGKIFPLTMATFCNLIKTSAGYISVLLATKN